MENTIFDPDYVSFDTAKILKVKNFNINSSKCYNESGTPVTVSLVIRRFKPERTYYPRPQLWEVVKWLRVEHGIDIAIIPDSSSGERLLMRTYTYSIFTPVPHYLHCQIGRNNDNEIVYFSKPESATEAAIKQVLVNML